MTTIHPAITTGTTLANGAIVARSHCRAADDPSLRGGSLWAVLARWRDQWVIWTEVSGDGEAAGGRYLGACPAAEARAHWHEAVPAARAADDLEAVPECFCIIACALDREQWALTCEALGYARRVNDPTGTVLALARLSGRHAGGWCRNDDARRRVPGEPEGE